MNENRLDASLLDPEELERFADLVIREEKPALIGREGVRIDLPEPIFHLLVRIVHMMREGRGIVLLPEDEKLTTQAAADFLGMSRQHFVDLLESGEVPFHLVGTHRRVYFKDVLGFQKKRDAERKGTLNRFFSDVDDAGLYDAPLPREHE